MAKERIRKISRRDDLAIESYIDGKGPALVILPSYGRDGATDYDSFTSDLVAAGYTILRPQPRGIAGSRGPMQDLSLHDLAADISLAICRWADGSAVVLGHAFGNLVARMLATDFPSMVKGLILASAQAKVVAPEIARTPAEACDLRSPVEQRLAALKLGFFAPKHDASIWLNGWYPETFHMQVRSVGPTGTRQSEYWAAGDAPMLEIIPDHDPFKPHRSWHELRDEFGDRVDRSFLSAARPCSTVQHRTDGRR